MADRSARRSPRVARAGREARMAARAAGPAVNPAAPGQISGRYQPLSEPEMAAITDTAFRLLSELGMGQATPELVEAATARGAEITPRGRLAFPRAMMEEIVAGAAKRFTFHGRDPAHNIEVGGTRTFFGTGGAAVQTLDLGTGTYRASTLRDLHDFTRLIDRLTYVSWFTRCCIATDVPDPYELDVNTAFALMKNTQKPVGTAFTLESHVDPIIDMVERVMERPFREAPCLKAHISPVVSPLRYGEDAVGVTRACIRRGVPINAIIAAQAGATAPATLAGFLAQSLAETLAGLALVAVFTPEGQGPHPVIFSNWPFVVDLRTGAFSGGGGETALLNAAAAQLSNRLGLPSGVASSMSDAKAVDAQMGAEKALSAVCAGLAGANMVYESAGMMAALLGVSFEAFVLDDEMLGAATRVLRGIEVDTDRMGYDAIAAAVLGEGHFLGSGHTMAAMERDYLFPKLADRDAPGAWAEKGSPDAWMRARARAEELLAEPAPSYVSAAAEAEIRARLPIRDP